MSKNNNHVLYIFHWKLYQKTPDIGFVLINYGSIHYSGHFIESVEDYIAVSNNLAAQVMQELEVTEDESISVNIESVSRIY